MPFTIKIENEVIRIALTGNVTSQDLVALAEETKVYEHKTAVIPHRITDLTGIEEIAIHYPDISMFAAKRMQLRFPNSFKSAIIVRDGLPLAYARMFQTLNENPQITIRIFVDESSANEWIADTDKFKNN